MGDVIQTKNKKIYMRRLVMAFIFGIIIIVGIIFIFVRRQKLMNITDGREEASFGWKDIVVKEMNYKEFENVFRPIQDNMQMVVEELNNEDLLRDKDYYIVFDPDLIIGKHGKLVYEIMEILYDNRLFYSDKYEEIAEGLNKNDVLKNALDEMKDQGIIDTISAAHLEEGMYVILFDVNTAYTPFITNNNGITNYFVYCLNEECQKYGYKKIEGNWYMEIPARPE